MGTLSCFSACPLHQARQLTSARTEVLTGPTSIFYRLFLRGPIPPPPVTCVFSSPFPFFSFPFFLPLFSVGLTLPDDPRPGCPGLVLWLLCFSSDPQAASLLSPVLRPPPLSSADIHPVYSRSIPPRPTVLRQFRWSLQLHRDTGLARPRTYIKRLFSSQQRPSARTSLPPLTYQGFPHRGFFGGRLQRRPHLGAAHRWPNADNFIHLRAVDDFTRHDPDITRSTKHSLLPWQVAYTTLFARIDAALSFHVGDLSRHRRNGTTSDR